MSYWSQKLTYEYFPSKLRQPRKKGSVPLRCPKFTSEKKKKKKANIIKIPLKQFQ